VAYISVGIHLDHGTHVKDERSGDVVYLQVEGSGASLRIYLPQDDESAESALDMLRAAIDNAASYVELRKKERLYGKPVALIEAVPA
jgi:hypothetical protein